MTKRLQKSVLIVEDQHHTRDRLRLTLLATDDLRVDGVASTLADGLAKLAILKPDFLLTDLGLPDGSGIDMIRAARDARWTCSSMVFSVFGDERRVVDAIRAGAKGYILKTTSPEDIARDIREVLNGGSPITPKIARYLLAHLTEKPQERPDVAQPLPDAQVSPIALTRRETEVLDLVAQGYKRSEVGERLNISVGTVGNHIHNIYRKLEVSSNIEAVMVATRSGLI